MVLVPQVNTHVQCANPPHRGIICGSPIQVRNKRNKNVCRPLRERRETRRFNYPRYYRLKTTDGLNARRAAIHEMVKPAREAGGRIYFNLRIVCTDMTALVCDSRIQAICGLIRVGPALPRACLVLWFGHLPWKCCLKQSCCLDASILRLNLEHVPAM